MVSIVCLLNFQVSGIDGGILLKFLLFSVLSLSRLGSTLFIEIRMANMSLQLFEFITFSAHFLDLTLATLVNYFEFGHFTGQVFLHGC